MTTTQLLVITATIYIAPHLPKWLAALMTSGLCIAAALIGLGWMT